MMPREDMFSRTHGVAIQMEQRIYRVPSVTGVLLDERLLLGFSVSYCAGHLLVVRALYSRAYDETHGLRFTKYCNLQHLVRQHGAWPPSTTLFLMSLSSKSSVFWRLLLFGANAECAIMRYGWFSFHNATSNKQVTCRGMPAEFPPLHSL